MNHTVKLFVHLDGDAAISKPSKEIEVADEKQAILATINYGARCFSISAMDVVTLPSGQVVESEKKHITTGVLVVEAPRKRDDAIIWYSQKLTEAFAKVAGNFDADYLEKSIDYLKTQNPDDYFVCERINVGMPERRGRKYFDYNANLLLDLT